MSWGQDMDAPSGRKKFATLLLVGSILATAAAVLFRPQAQSAPVAAQTAAAPAANEQFERWVEQDAEAGKGRIVGVVEKDGTLVEVREAPQGEGAVAGEEPAEAQPGLPR